MTTTIDDYLAKVIQQGDEGSDLLAKHCRPTLKNNPYVSIIPGPTDPVAVLDIPVTHDVLVHSAAGDPTLTDVHAHARSVVARLCAQAQQLGATPLAFANVIDSRTGDLAMLEAAVTGLVAEANKNHLAIMNGENAILGYRVIGEANIMGTMISMLPKENQEVPLDRALSRHHISFARFNPSGQYVFINADGTGTKTDICERAKRPTSALEDFAAMNLDDASKLRAIAKVLSGVLEFTGEMPVESMLEHARILGRELDITILLQPENATGRIQQKIMYAHNISGAVVSVIDKAEAQTPLRASAGDYLVAIVGKPNPRANGLTAKREAMEQLFGQQYEYDKLAAYFLQYLAEPSTILYPVFHALLKQGLATNVYHMSGGAYKGKLAKPLAKHDLFVHIENLFQPDPRELMLLGAKFTSAQDAYAKFPMGNDGFVATQHPLVAIQRIQDMGLRARVVGQLQQAVDGRTGVEIEYQPKKIVYYSGNEKN